MFIDPRKVTSKWGKEILFMTTLEELKKQLEKNRQKKRARTVYS